MIFESKIARAVRAEMLDPEFIARRTGRIFWVKKTADADYTTFSAEHPDYEDGVVAVDVPGGHAQDHRGAPRPADVDPPGVRAAPCHDDLTAERSRRHKDLNILCLSADLLGVKLIDHMVEIWLSTEFDGGRHARRVEKIDALDQQLGAVESTAPLKSDQ